MLFVVRILLSFFTAYFFGRVIYCHLSSSSEKNTTISRFHSLFLGLGFTSITFWLYTVATNGYNSNYPIVETGFVIIVYLYFYLKKKKSIKQNCLKLHGSFSNCSSCQTILLNHDMNAFSNNIKASLDKDKLHNKEQKENNKSFDFIVIILFLLIAFLIFVRCLRYPDGTWDAIAILNLKAKFLACGNEVFTGIFSDYYDYIHRDYPLFLPSLVARGHVYARRITNVIPVLFSFLFSISSFIFPYLYLKKLKSKYYAIFSICLLSFSPYFFYEYGRQYADMPLAVFFLISLYELIKWERERYKSLPWLCFIFSSLCFWIKNEGIPWFLFYSLFVGYYSFKKEFWGTNKNKYFLNQLLKEKLLTKFISLFLCVVPPLLSYTLVKFMANSDNDLMKGIFARLGQIFSVERYLLISLYVFHFMKKHLWILVIPIYLLLGFKDKRYRSVSILLLLIVFMIIFYQIMLILTPNDLLWHLESCFTRIFTHFLPSLIFLSCLLFDFKRDK